MTSNMSTEGGTSAAESTELIPSKEEVLKQLNKICREMVEEDKTFGDGMRFLQFEIDGDKEGADQFAAAAIFGNVRFEEANTSTTHTVPLVIKTEPTDKDTREFFNSHLQFSNEILFYTQLLPFLNSFKVGSARKCSETSVKPSLHSASSSYPFAKFLKGGNSDPVLASYVIMENASSQGFRLSESRQLLDLDHFLLLMDRLGRFHALSYIAKSVNPAKLFSLVSHTKETSWTDERLLNGHESESFIRVSVMRSLRKFDNSAQSGESKQTSGSTGNDGASQTSGSSGAAVNDAASQTSGSSGAAGNDAASENYQLQVDRVKCLLADEGKQIGFMKDVTTPQEPMAVLCHGDFCRNNILFQYGNATSTSPPEDVLFFDMATIRYSSPVIDLSFCLYLNSDAALRRLHWDAILKSYHDGLKETVEAFAGANGVQVNEGKSTYDPSCKAIFFPSLADVHSEFHRHALYGFVHCSFFLPAMLTPATALDEMTPVGEEFWNLTMEEKLASHDERGGEEGTRMLNDIVRHLFDMGFV